MVGNDFLLLKRISPIFSEKNKHIIERNVICFQNSSRHGWWKLSIKLRRINLII